MKFDDLSPLARWFHDRRVGCDYELNDPGDMGMGRHHTGDHESQARSFLEAMAYNMAYKDPETTPDPPAEDPDRA